MARYRVQAIDQSCVKHDDIQSILVNYDLRSLLQLLSPKRDELDTLNVYLFVHLLRNHKRPFDETETQPVSESV